MTEAYPPPHPTTGILKEIILTGMLMPWVADHPALVNMYGVGSQRTYLPLFDDPDKLRSVLKRAAVPVTSIKFIYDGPQFLDSIPDDIIVITNLRYTDEGKVRFNQVHR
jgi:hypothetical protein